LIKEHIECSPSPAVGFFLVSLYCDYYSIHVTLHREQYSFICLSVRYIRQSLQTQNESLYTRNNLQP